MTGHSAKFGRKQEEAIAALLPQRNTDEAARAVGVAPKTLLRWLQIPDFPAAYRKARRALEASRDIQFLTCTAVPPIQVSRSA